MKYLKDVVQKWDEHIRLQQEDLLDYERDLAVLYEPFTNLMRLYRGDRDRTEHQSDISMGKNTNEFLAIQTRNLKNFPIFLINISLTPFSISQQR